MKQTFKQMKLSKKINLVMSVLTIVFITCIILVISVRSVISNDQVLMDQFNGASKYNAYLIDYKFNLIESTIDELSKYIADASIQPNNISGQIQSNIYNVELSEQEFIIEENLINYIWGSVSAIPVINSIGVYFEPYAFSNDIETFAFVAFKNNLKSKELFIHQNYDEYSQENYYLENVETNNTHITLPWIDMYENPVISISKPLIKNGKTIGVISADLLLEEFSDIKISIDKYPEIISSILDNELNIIYEAGKISTLGMNYQTIFKEKSLIEIQKNMELGEPFELRTYTIDNKVHERFFYPLTIFNETWWMHIAIKSVHLYIEILLSLFISIVITLLAIICIRWAISLASKKLLAQLDSLMIIANNISNGDLSTSIKPLYDDDIGHITTCFNDMGQTINIIITEMELILHEMSDGNFAIKDKITEIYIGDFATIKDSFINISEKLQNTLQLISITSTKVKHNAINIADSATILTQSSQQQTNAVYEFLAIAEDMSKVIEQINATASQTAQSSELTIQNTSNSKSQIDELLFAMNKISKSSNTISDVLGIIQSITEQTNLLALNAAIEASRAGDAGRGFAVVANEIRELANRSSKTVKEVEFIIKENMQYASNAQEIVNNTAQYLEGAYNIIEETSILQTTLLEMSTVQKESINTLIYNIQNFSDSITSTAAVAGENTAISEELATQTAHLEKLLQSFKF
ncbi:hypothetical protein AN641_02780 [Candidatus Epulonipiscioides gigas]|nr:hypothetical protein AN641_02780 [Epulopiscium sp. SCG-C07WGA-EpuloA2]